MKISTIAAKLHQAGDEMDALPENRREEDTPDELVLSFIVDFLTDKNLCETLKRLEAQ
jgi:hypothetical protein